MRTQTTIPVSSKVIEEPDFCGVGKSITTRNVDEALAESGLDFTVSKQQNVIIGADVKFEYDADSKLLVLDGDSVYNGLTFPEQQPIIRDDTREVLCNMGRGYTPVQNKDCVGTLRDLLLENQEVKLLRGGNLKNCDRLFLTARVGKNLLVGNDSIQRLLSLNWSHTGKISVEIEFVPYLNRGGLLLNVESGRDACRYFKHKHTKKVMDKVQTSMAIIADADKYFESICQVFRRMFENPMSISAMDDFLKIMFKDKGENTRNENKRNDVVSLFQTNAVEVGENKWSAFTSVCEYVDKQGSTRKTKDFSENEVRLDNIWFGSGAKIKQEAFELLTS